MKIVIVNDFGYINGGASKVAIDSALGLSGEGADVYFFSSVGPVDQRFAENDLEVICLGQEEILKDQDRLRAVKQGLWNRIAKRAMRKLLADLSPADTVIHLHSWTKALSSSVVREATCRGFKVVCTLHDYFVACPNGGFFHYGDGDVCRLTPMSFDCLRTNCDVRTYGQKLYRVLRQYIQVSQGMIPKGIDGFIYISKFSRDILERSLPESAKLFFVENPIDCKKEPPVDPKKSDYFVSVGRVSPEKGVERFLRAARLAQAKAVVVGGGMSLDECKMEFKEAMFSGWVSAEKAKEVMSGARALVFPSLCYETQGLVVLEALAKGVPVIVSTATAARDFVIHRETGLLYEGENQLRECIEKLLIDPAYAAELGRNGYVRFWNNPPVIDHHVERLFCVYGKVLASAA